MMDDQIFPGIVNSHEEFELAMFVVNGNTRTLLYGIRMCLCG